MTTKHNEHGEAIHVKLEKGKVKVHHTDCTDGFISLDKLFVNYILDAKELPLIYSAIKEEYYASPEFAHISENIKQMFV